MEGSLQQRNRELALLNRVIQVFNSTLDLDQVLVIVLEEVRRLLDIVASSIWLVDQTTGELVGRQATGPHSDIVRGWRLAPGKGIVGWVAAHGESQIIPDLRQDERHFKGVDQQTGLPILSILSVPLQVKQEVIGVLQVVDAEAGRFDQTDLMLLEPLAAAAATAIENARLYKRAQQEIAERQRVAAALQESEERFRSVVQTANDAIVTVDSRGRIIFWNRTAETMFDYSAGEMVGRPLSLIIPKQFQQTHQTGILRAISTKRADLAGRTVELTGLKKDGSELPLELSFAVWKTREESFSTAILRDVTERKQAEAALADERATLARRVKERTAELSRANAELARAARLKDEFLASMSHELRTPLNAVLGLSEALQEEIYGPLNEKQLRSLHSIEESGRHLLALITDILDVSKIEAGKLELELGPVPVESVCQASLRLIKQDAHKKRLQVSSHFDSAVTVIQADNRRLKQILVNLLSNAVKFTPEGGEMGLEMVGDQEQGVVRFVVWDTGIGIAEQDIGRLFQPFVQLDSSLSRRYAGTGLGLSLVYRLAEMHGGSVSVESEVGKGSRFTVSLPWRRAAEQQRSGEAKEIEPARQRPSPPRTHTPLILLAEDNQANVDVMSDCLLSEGYRVIIAWDGGEAIERAKEERPDLILMDIQMPGMDGLEATRHIRADAEQSVADVPIIALTALAMPGDQERCLAAGANAYLSKPVSLRGLIEAIEARLEV